MANNNNTKNLNVPNLRFPEFKGEWEKIIIDDLGDIVTGTTPPTNNHSNYGNEYLWASPADLGGVKYITDTKTKLSQLGFDRTRKIAKNSILVTCIGSTIGKMGMASTNMCTNQQINSIIVNKNYDDNFVYYAINSRFPKYLSSVAMQAVPIISKSAFEKLENYTPKYEEQKKIGLFLSLIDQRIENQSKIIEKYESLIKGLRYYILEESTHYNCLGNLCDIIKGQQVNLDNLLKHGKYYVMNGGTQPSGYYNSYNTDAGTISISEGGNSCGYIQYNKENFWSGGHCYTLQNIKSELTKKYLYHYLKSNEKMIMALRVGSGLPNIQKKDLMSLRIPIPAKENQKKISCLLDSIEDKISVETNVLKHEIRQKSYLLRQMFI